MATAETILSNYEPAVSALGFQLREYVFDRLKGVHEYPDAASKIIGFGFGPGYKATICTIIPSKKGMKLGFYKGSELPDPDNLLTGAGKVHKHVVIESEKDLKKASLKKLLAEALKAYQKRKTA